jgi:two-component system nitrogen regulation sensor histidine kinase NtrY
VTFRSKLFVNFMLALLLSVALVTAGVTVATRRAFDELNRQHTDALVEQFQREFDRRGHDVLHRVQGIAEAEPTVRMAIDLSRPNADISVYVNDARGVAQSHQLDFLDFVGTDGSIISSAEWSARFGYKMEWVTQKEDWASRGSFLMRLDTQEGPALALLAVAAVRVGDKDLYVVGGERLGKEFLASLVLPENMRALLYLNLDPAFQPVNLIDSAGSVAEAERFEPIIERERAHPSALTEKINWTFDAASAEIFHAIPKLGRQNELLGVLLIGNSQRTVVTLERHILWLAIGVAAIGILFGLFLSWWAAARVTLPVRRLAAGAREVSDGNWNTRVVVRGTDEIGQLAQSFNRMTQELVDQRERLIQAERVAAWREVARRLAHELKNPLFPLQTTVENLQRASTQNPDQFEEVFRESTGILLAEIENLKIIVGRFSDFAKMPQPELGPVDLNDIVRNVVKLFEAQFCAVGRPPITPELHLGENLPTIQADTTLLHRAIENLILNAMDAMPAGGILMMRTAQNNGNVDFEISDTGVGLTREEADRIFTPYYTTKQHGTGLGLAIVQAIVADHNGRITVESEMGVGTAFHLELPVKPPHHPNQTTPDVVAQEAEKKEEA